jgi:hypothetical protein
VDAVSIVNAALDKLGTDPIVSLSDDVKQARNASRMYGRVRDLELTLHTWRFSVARTTLAALNDAPAFGYARAFQLPTDFLRLLWCGDYAPGIDLSEIRTGMDSPDWTIEGRQILSNHPSPLKLVYVRRVTNETEFSPEFTECFVSRLAVELSASLTDSNPRVERAQADYQLGLRAARRANAIQLPPQPLADDSWLIARGL